MPTLTTREVCLRLLQFRSALPLTAITAVLCFSPRPADATVTFDWVTVGDAGNPADTLVMDKGPAADFTTGYGAVDYEYRIADKHVTNAQYTEFLNAVDPNGDEGLDFTGNGLYNSNMSMSFIGGGTGTDNWEQDRRATRATLKKRTICSFSTKRFRLKSLMLLNCTYSPRSHPVF